MKLKKTSDKLTLKRSTIASLNQKKLESIIAGRAKTWVHTCAFICTSDCQ